MDNLSLYALDISVAVILLLSALMAFSRGLVREAFSIAAWVGAVAATIYGYDPLRPLMRRYIEQELVADAATALGIFLGTLVVCSIFAYLLSRLMRQSGALGALDRSLGLVFGLVRGAVLVSAAYIGLAYALPSKEWPLWISEARSLPLIAAGSEQLRAWLPKDMLRAADEAAKSAKSALDQAGAAAGLLGQGSQPGADSAVSPDGSGYNDAQRNDLDRLIQGSQPQ